MRILITEEALRKEAGHWPVYIGDIARGLRTLGDTVDVLAHCQADPRLLSRLAAEPWLTRSCWSDGEVQGQLGGLRHSVRFARELKRWLVSQDQPYDWICSLTMRLPHLLAYTLLTRTGGIPACSRCLLLFVQGFGVYAGPGQMAEFPVTASNRLASWCFRRLRHRVLRRQVVLAAETEAMRQELETFSGLPVELFPHPVQVDPRGSTTRRAPAMAADRQVTITCPGYARYEKGNDLLQEACRMIWQEPGCEQVHVVCQWPEPFTMPDGRQMGPDPTLVADPRFELCNEHLDASTYQALLNRTDLVVLPYRRESYSNRVSRVAIEAAIQGIPILPMCGTWAEELAQLAGGEDVIKAETAEAVAAAVSASVRRLKERRSHALKNSNNIARFHSAKNFHRKLLVLACREL